MSNVADFINKLNDVKKQEIINIWVPSLSKECTFTPLTVKQQKELLRASVGGVVGVIDFAKILNEIILSNSIDKTIEFNTIDKNVILLGLKKYSLGSTVNIDGKTYDLKELPLSQKIYTKKLIKKINYKDIEVLLSSPSLKKELDLYEFCSIDIKKLKDNTVNESVPILYVTELIKFIENIVFEGNIINFTELSNNDKKLIVENLPLGLTQQIVDYIATVRSIEDSFITFTDGVKVAINTLFFSTE